MPAWKDLQFEFTSEKFSMSNYEDKYETFQMFNANFYFFSKERFLRRNG